jgi:predicted dehydrogenase
MDASAEGGRKFANATGAEFVATTEELCRHSEVDYVDVCAPPSFRLPVVELGARYGKAVLVEKPMAIDLETARQMIVVARQAGIQLGVVSQHRFDDSTLFLKRAIEAGRMGRILQADAYVKWYRSAEYYSRPVKGSWAGEGGGALINQAIHQVDLLLDLIGPVDQVMGQWQLGGVHKIESEDSLSALLHYSSGALGVIQAATSYWPGYPERIEIHGEKGSATITGDQLTAWDVRDDRGEAAPIKAQAASGASDPMAISLMPLERQLRDFGESSKAGRAPACSGVDGFSALQLVRSIYASCQEARRVAIAPIAL